MKAREIEAALERLAGNARHLEDIYIENEGEVTDETEALEAENEALRELLTGDGVDSLGRWLKGKEDEKTAVRAEKAAIDRRIKSLDKTIDYIKSQIRRIMDETGTEKVKGLCYSFSAATSDTVAADNALIAERYGERASFALHAAGIPDYITCKLTGSASLAKQQDTLPDVFIRTIEKTVRFNKPRKSKEEEA